MGVKMTQALDRLEAAITHLERNRADATDGQARSDEITAIRTLIEEAIALLGKGQGR